MKILIYLIALILIVSSCMPLKNLEYLQDTNTITKVKITDGDQNEFRKAEEHKISANDELLIKVSSFDDVSFNYFNTQNAATAMQASNELSINMVSYAVDVDGYVSFPIVGKLLLKGLTLAEASEKIQSVLRPYFDQPNVQVKYAYKKVSVLGEVNSPGYYSYTKDQLTILEALALASDMTLHGNRKEVILIRKQEDDKAYKYQIDLTKDNDVFGYNYYVQPGDIIYVKPRPSVKWSEISTPITLFFSTITTALLVFDALGD